MAASSRRSATRSWPRSPRLTARRRRRSKSRLNMSKQRTSKGAPIALHIGFHSGPAIEDAGDVFGDCVNVAARLTEFAKGGQIFTSAHTVGELSPAMKQRTRDQDAHTLKGKERGHQPVRADVAGVGRRDDDDVAAKGDGARRASSSSMGRATSSSARRNSVLTLGPGPAERRDDRRSQGIAAPRRGSSAAATSSCLSTTAPTAPTSRSKASRN